MTYSNSNVVQHGWKEKLQELFPTTVQNKEVSFFPCWLTGKRGAHVKVLDSPCSNRAKNQIGCHKRCKPLGFLWREFAGTVYMYGISPKCNVRLSPAESE